MKFLCILALSVGLSTVVHAACRIGGPFPYEAPINCPEQIRDYLERTGACAHFAGEEAYDGERAASLQEKMEALRCDRLREDFAAIWAEYEGDVDYARLMEAYHARYGFAYPPEE